jgi:hypothetical protein
MSKGLLEGSIGERHASAVGQAVGTRQRVAPMRATGDRHPSATRRVEVFDSRHDSEARGEPNSAPQAECRSVTLTHDSTRSQPRSRNGSRTSPPDGRMTDA